MNTVEQQVRYVEFTLRTGTVLINPLHVQAIYRGGANVLTTIVLTDGLTYEVELDAKSVAKRLRGLA